MKRVRVLHERDAGGAHEVLAVYEQDGGSRVYGVERDGEIVMTGTKAEAKEYYGNWRKL